MLAGLIGPTLVAGGASMLLNLGSLPALIGQASGDAALILTTGMLIFVAGLAIVRVHNLFVLGGLLRILFPTQLGSAAARMAQETWFWVGEAVILLVLGGFLCLEAYSQARWP